MKSKKNETGSEADEVASVATPKARSRKKAAEETGAEAVARPAKKAAKKSAAQTASDAAEEPKAEKKTRARKTKEAAGRDLVAEVPGVAEVAGVLHVSEEEALEELESQGGRGFAESVAEEPADEQPEFETELSESTSDDDEDQTDDETEDESGNESYQEKPGNPERLQKVLAKAGIASRRAAEEMILAGRIQVNGKVVTELGTKAELGRDHIRVDGKLIHHAERLRYFVLNKPKGYVTTVSDPEGRPTVMQFFAGERERLYPVGRLDYLSEGLLLVTNDGELANKLTKAASGVEKTYLVKVAGTPGEEELDQIREGVVIERGRIGSGSGRVRTAPAQIRKVREGDNPWYEVILIEGRNREIRKLFEEIGHHVEKIRRVGYGPLVLDLEPGKMRELTEDEVHKLRLTAEGKLKPRRRRGPAPAQLERTAGRAVQYGKGGRDARRPATGAARESRPDRSERPQRAERSERAERPGRFERSEAPRQSTRGVSTGLPTGKRNYAPAPRAEQAERPARKRFGKAAEGNFGRERRGGEFREERAGQGRGREERKPFRASRPDRSRDEAPRRERPAPRHREPEDFGTEPIPRTPGFRVEPVESAPRAPRLPRAESFGAGRPGNKPFRPQGGRPAQGDRPFRKPEGRPTSGRPPAKSFGGRPSRPFRERDSESSRGAGERSGGPRRESREGRGDRGDFRPRRPFGERSEGEDRPREFRPRPGGRPSAGSRSAGGARPGGSSRPKPFAARPESRGRSERDQDEKGSAPRVKNRWRNSFEGKNKGRPKPKPKRDA